MPTIGHYATLKNLLFEMERDLQISGRSDTDKRVMSTLVLLDEGRYETVHLNDIRDHALTKSIPAPSLYRSFQTLYQYGLDQQGWLNTIRTLPADVLQRMGLTNGS